MSTMGTTSIELPQQIVALIEAVVRRTRLWRREKKDVRAELEAHFRDGLEAKVSEGAASDHAAVSLIQEFGDPRLAARLIRRGKKRARSPIWKLFVAISWMLVLTVVVLILYVGWIFTGRAKPSVDYVAKFNAPIDAIPVSDRSWPILRDVILALTPMPAEVSDAKQELADLTPSSEAWPSAMAWVQANHHLVEDIQRAAQRPAFGCRYDNHEAQRFLYELNKRRQSATASEAAPEFVEPQVDPLMPPTPSILLPWLVHCRDVTRFLVLNARVHAVAGEWEAAWESLDAAHRLGFQLLPCDTLIEQLVGAANLNLTMDTSRSILYDARETLSATELSTLRTKHLVTASSKTIQADLNCERFMFEDVVQYVFTNNGNGDGHAIPQALLHLMPLASDPNRQFESLSMVGLAAVHAGRKATLAKYHEISEKMDRLYSLPLYDPARQSSDQLLKTLIQSGVDPRGLRYALIGLMIPSLDRADQRMREAAMNQAATQAVVALLAYRADHGRLPERLEALAPDYLASVPTDAYSGHELRYSVDAHGEFMLYSVGQNLTDDHGNLATITTGDHTGSLDHLTDDHGNPTPITTGVHTGNRLDLVYWPPSMPLPTTASAE